MQYYNVFVLLKLLTSINLVSAKYQREATVVQNGFVQ